MLDLAGIMFSSVMMLMVIVQAVRLDQTQPWFQAIKTAKGSRCGKRADGADRAEGFGRRTMLRSLWLLFVYVAFLGLSASAPFVATLGYVWVDTFAPQNVAYILLNQIPVAMIMGAVAVGTYLLLDRRSPPPLSAKWLLMVAIMIWVNLTMIWAEVPQCRVGEMGLGLSRRWPLPPSSRSSSGRAYRSRLLPRPMYFRWRRISFRSV